MDVSPFYRWAASATALAVFMYAIDKMLSLQRAFAKIKEYPGRALLWITPFGTMAAVLGPRFPRPSMTGSCGGKFSSYRKFGATAFAAAELTTARLVFWFADAEAIKLITTDRHTFQKLVRDYEMIKFYGENIISAEGSTWKRHRSVVMSAFNEANIASVWSESLRVANEWFEQLDAGGSDITVDLLPATEQVTLLVIAAASFGKPISWFADPNTPLSPGFKLTFRSAFLGALHNVILRVLIPGWFYKLSSVIKLPYLSARALHTQLAFDELRKYMLDLISSARTEVSSGESTSVALLRNIVEANMSQDTSSKTLTEEETLSNIFVFLFAGNETSTRTLCFAVLFLTLYPECQKKVYDEVNLVWPAGVSRTQLTTNYQECLDKLEYTLACIREALRLIPVLPRIPRDVHADTVLPGTYTTPGPSKQNPLVETGKFTMAIPAGSLIVVDIWGLHMNPLYWGEDTAEFKPERFIDTESYKWPRNAFLPFSSGARSCLAQRFAVVEMVAVLASIVHRYEVRVPDDLANKPFDVQKETLLEWTTGTTLTPLNARVKLCRRF